MDHRRIEWLFLIVFLLIDIYLGVEIWRSPVSLSDENAMTANTTIRTEMRTDGIDVPSNISKVPSSGYYLAAKKKDYLSSKISSLTGVTANYSRTENNITATPRSAVIVKGSRKAIIKKIKAFIDDPQNMPYGKQFKYEPNLSGSSNYTFIQSSELGDIYDNGAQLVVNVKNGIISNYTLTYMGPVSSVRELQSTISPWRAIKSMYTDREIANNSRIVKIKLGYSKLTEVRGSIILLPTWIVWIENKTTKNITMKRVNAFTGQMLQTNTAYNLQK